MQLPSLSSWPEIRSGALSATEFRKRHYPDEVSFLKACDETGAYPVELKANRTPAGQLRHYASFLSLFQPSWTPQQESAHPWPVPIGSIGPVLFLAHFDPSARPSFAQHYALYQMVTVSPASYIEMREHFIDQLDYVNTQFSTLPMPASPIQPLSTGGQDGAEINALRFLLVNSLVALSDLGVVRSALAEGGFSSDKLSADYQLALAHIAKGSRIGSHSFAKNGGLSLPAVNQSLIDRYKFLPFNQEGRSIFVYTPLTDEHGLTDILASKLPGKAHRVYVTKAHLTLLAQTEAVQKKVVAVEGTKADSGVSSKVVAIDPREVGAFDQTAASENHEMTTKRILWDAVTRGATDIHIEAFNETMRVRISIDHTGVVALQLPLVRIKGISAMLKTWCGIPHDGNQHREGRLRFAIGTREIDVRVSLLIDGNGAPKWTLRLQDKDVGVRSTSQLGLSEDDLRILREAYRKKHGIMLVSGPTSHGKTTTLYSCLNDLRSTERFLYTLEDPIEFTMPGVTQIVATSDPEKIAKGAMSFAEGITRLLRAQPHVIMVGEMRDPATATAGVEASMTGHLVLSTTHANDSCALIDRMIGLKAEPLLFSESLVMASSQRLLRRLCACHEYVKTPYDVSKVFARNRIPTPSYINVPHAGGCEQCNGTGYKGRTVVMEFLPMGDEVRKVIASARGSAVIRSVARKQGFKTMFERGLLIVAEGSTSYEEMSSYCIEHSQ